MFSSPDVISSDLKSDVIFLNFSIVIWFGLNYGNRKVWYGLVYIFHNFSLPYLILHY